MSATIDVDGVDPIDSRLGAPAEASGVRWSRRLALGLAAAPVPAFALLLTGVALGPAGLGVLPARVLSAIEPVTAAALMALGVLIGLDVDIKRRGGASRLLAGAALESGVTLVVLAAVFTTISRLPVWPWSGSLLLSVLIGIGGAASATLASRAAVPSMATRLGDLDDLLPILLGGVVLAAAAATSAGDAAAVLAVSVALALVIAVSGSWLASETGGEGEQRVYATGTLLLLTGVAAYVSASALFVGAVAGAAWNAFNPAGRERLARDLRYLQHPVIVLLLVVAGAQAGASPLVVACGGLFALARLGGKVAGGALASAVIGGGRQGAGLSLLASGVAGVGFALNATQGAGTAVFAVPLLGIVVWGAVFSDLLALVVGPSEAQS